MIGQSTWNYFHRDSSTPIVHVIISNSTQLNEYPVLKQKLLEIQKVEFNNHLKGGFINVTNPWDTSWLVASSKMGYRYAVIWFDGCWPTTFDFNYELLTEIDRINQFTESDWFCAGQIKDYEEKYAYLDRTLILVNIKKWMENDMPNPLMDYDRQTRWQACMTTSHWEDSYYGIEKTKKQETGVDESEEYKVFNNQYHRLYGNSWISWSLNRQMYVMGLSDAIMDTLTTIKPHIGSHDLEMALQQKPYNNVISYQANKLINNIFNPSSPIYFVNTEPSRPGIAEQLVDTEFDQYVGASAGFKLLYYAYKYGVNPGFTRFVFYDFDEDSCCFKRDLFKEWDGEDLVSYVDEWCNRNPGVNTNLKELVNERWPIVVDQFGGKQSWQDFWTQVQLCDIRVVQCDLIYDHDTLFKELKSVRTFMWTSNIYSYIIPKLLEQPFGLEGSFMDLISKLNKLHDDCWFSGTDVNDNDLMCPARAILSVGNNNALGLE
jgi:hypothetical protein